jgi:hypothetical protein
MESGTMSNRSNPSVRLLLGLLSVFVVLSLADLFLTWKLIHLSDGLVFESNPVAGWWLDTWGWGGMTAFKLGMILVVGALAGGLAYLRPRTSELILVFACGAQSAVVLDSVFLTRWIDEQRTGLTADELWLAGMSLELDPGGDPPPPFSPSFLSENSMFLLLTHESVQEELRLSAAQVTAIMQLAAKRREIRPGFRRGYRDEGQPRASDLLAQENALLEDLEPKQAERLRQISWQQRGPFAFTDPDVVAALRLSVEQQETIHALVEEVRQARAPAFRPWGYRPEAARNAASALVPIRDRLWAVLSDDQKARWKQLTGEPFEGDLRPWPGRPFGSGRGSRSPQMP